MNSRFYAQAEVLVEIVRQGSMTAAAAVLRLSKSNISQKLAELEHDLDSVLLKRNTRSIQLTPAGQRVYDLCVRAVDALQLARGTVSHELQNTLPQGTVTISGSNLYLSEFIMPLLPALHQALPLVRVDLTGGDDPVDQRADAVDLRIRVGSTTPEGVKTYPLAPLQRGLCAHRDLLPLSNPIVSPADLSGLPLILRRQEPPEWVFTHAGETATHRVGTPAMFVNSYELCVAAVRAGLGAAVLARAVIQNDLRSGQLVDLLPDWTVTALPVSLVVPLSRLRRPEVMAVARSIVGSLPPDRPT